VFTIDFPGWTLLIPAAYFAYFIAAAWQYLPMHAPDKVRGLSDIKIPVSFASVEIIFGLGLLALNVLAWVQFAEQLASAG
jgi:hypothetical protein